MDNEEIINQLALMFKLNGYYVSVIESIDRFEINDTLMISVYEDQFLIMDMLLHKFKIFKFESLNHAYNEILEWILKYEVNMK